MSSSEDLERARAGSEARETIVRKPRSTSSAAIGEAMRRYLTAEQYLRLREETEDDTGSEQSRPVTDDNGKDT